MMDQLARFRSNLADIADAYALLAARDRDDLRDERTKPGHDRRHREYHDNDTSTVVYGQTDGSTVVADPIAHAMPSGPSKQASTGPIVGGSTEAKVPINLDEADLLGPANAASVTVAETTPWRKDQIGHIAVSSELDFHVRDIANLLGDPLPMPTAPVLAMWLHERAEWAWDHYWALDRLVVDADRIARTLHAVTNPRRPRAEPKAAPCPGCGEATLSGDGERVTCSMEDCGRILTEPEYTEWSRLVVVRQAMNGWGISAREIAFISGKPIGTVHRWAAEFAWTRTGKERRPVLYCKDQVDVSLAKIAAREAKARAEQEARAA